MQAQVTEVANSWKMRDFITLAIFNVVMIIILTFCSIFTAVSPLIVGGITALLNGPIYMVMSNKIGKRGVLFYSLIINGLYFLAYGYVYYLITFAVVGIVCELVMWKTDSYRNLAKNTTGFAIFSVGYTLCGVMPLIFFREQYLAIVAKGYTPEQLEHMVYYFGTPSMVVLMSIISAAGALAGCYIGNLLFHKNVKKAILV
jgi:energy-coupling factor transport system substrate-specific component